MMNARVRPLNEAERLALTPALRVARGATSISWKAAASSPRKAASARAP